MTNYFRSSIIVIATSFVVACGGGGEDSSVTPTVSSDSSSNTVVTNKPPVINVATDITTKENTYIRIDASASTDTDGDITSYQWRQVSGQSIALQNTDTDIVSFNSPNVDKTETMLIELIVTDNDNESTTTQIAITVEDTTLRQPTVSLQREGNNLQVSWDDVNAESYRLIYWQEGAKPLQLNTTSRVLNLSNLSSGTYTIIVEAYDALGHSIFSKPSLVGV